MVEMVDLNRGGSHQALDAFGYGHVIGIGIVGINRRGVGGGDNHLAALRLGVPGFANVGDQGKIGNAGNAINRNDADGAAFGLQAYWLYASLDCRHASPQAPAALTRISVSKIPCGVITSQAWPMRRIVSAAALLNNWPPRALNNLR